MNNFSGVKDSKKAVINLKIIIFIITLVALIEAYFLISPMTIKTLYGPNVRQQLNSQFTSAVNKKYDCLFLGSSEMYRGINPEYISVSSFNFGFEMESFNQQWYKLKYLEKNNVEYKYLVLGLDYLDFTDFQDKRNYAYKKYFDKAYFDDYKKDTSIKGINDEFNAYVKGQYLDKIPDFTKAVLVKLNVLKNKDKATYAFLKDNGQLVNPHIDSLKRTNRITISDMPKKRNIQEKYFEKIVQYSKEKNIKLILVVLPKYRSYDKKISKEYEMFIKDKLKGTDVIYLNYQDNIGFRNKDFYDDAHLTQEGADKFTKMFNKDLIKVGIE